MESSASEEEIGGIDWTTDDEIEIGNTPASSCSVAELPGAEISARSSLDPSKSMVFYRLLEMGFPESLIKQATERYGENDLEKILETLISSSDNKSSPEDNLSFSSGQSSSQHDVSLLDVLSDTNSWSETGTTEETATLPEKEKILVLMGYPIDVATTAVQRCGTDSSYDELIDFIFVAEMAKRDDDHMLEHQNASQPTYAESGQQKRRKPDRQELYCRKKCIIAASNEDAATIRPPRLMVGFGVPKSCDFDFSPVTHRTLPTAAIGPPLFYYENVALAPKGVWDTISRFLYDVEPEFVDSKYFCAAVRKRGYVHNLPIQNRSPLLPLPAWTIQEAFPLTREWWPSWDTRKQLNCLLTCVASAKLTESIRKALEASNGDPPIQVQKHVMYECRKWNLVWVGRNKVAPLEPDELEMILGYPRDHTRGGIGKTDRYKSLGNSFQVDTVAYHLSVLKDMFKDGINVLSLFCGIGGAEVALDRLGIPLKNVVSVEKSAVNRRIVRSWWEQTDQKGRLIDFDDVRELNGDRLEQLISSTGGFDLVIGGSPCNNLTGSNRHCRNGLEGTESSLFYDYCRILDLVRCIMGSNV